MIGERGGEGVEDMVRERNVPLFIAKVSIKLAHGRFLLSVAPSEFSVLEMNGLEITRVKSVSEAHNPSPIHIPAVFVICLVYLIEISRKEPFCARRRLGSDNLTIELRFEVVAGRTVDGGQLEGNARLDKGDGG